jgi:hypothetical protein
MRLMSRNDTDTGSRLNTLLSDLRRRVELLTADIATEEERSKKFDLADPTYPALARSLQARRQNLLATISTLQAVEA